MSKGKVKTILFLIVFLLMLAILCNLLMDLNAEKEAAEKAKESPAPVETEEVFDPFSGTPAPAETVEVPVSTPVPVETPAPTPEPSLEPIILETPAPTPEPIPADTVIGGGSFMSDTGVPLNVRADWTAVTLDDTHVKVLVDVYLISYQIDIISVPNSVNVRVGDSYQSVGNPPVKHEENTELTTLLGSTEHILYLEPGMNLESSISVEYHFGGVYSKQELPTIDCGGYIYLSR